MVADSPVMVAEFTTNHLGNLNLLLAMVDAAAAAGCDFVKMQKKDVASFYTADKLDAPFRSPYGHTYREYREIFEFAHEDFLRLDARCRARGVPWFATAQDVASLEFLLEYDLPMLKVASCNARNFPFLKEVARLVPSSTPVVVSLAGSTLEEIDTVVGLFADRHLYLLHCVAEYPSRPERLRLGNLVELARRFASPDVTIGYSGHEVGVAASAAAMDLGAEMVERHFCLTRHSFAHHIECSLQPDEFARVVDAGRHPERRAPLYAELDPRAFATEFGMSDVEQDFLVAQSYGRAHLGSRSDFGG